MFEIVGETECDRNHYSLPGLNEKFVVFEKVWTLKEDFEYETLELWREKTDNQKIQSRKTTRKPLKIKKSYGGASVEDIHLNQWVMAMIHPEVSEIPRLCQRYGVYKEAQPNLILVAFVLLSF